ncbi:hypothetical protein Csa_008157 [Cucumis sativus]|uniref:Uncharacterized protein n=1 Tax=Cucumis sativus TaxID=3659 RepID=A0A0A0KTE4_CUCSA|nr:hypothetical protein Csa_008157 [Cucumis sativus]
MKSEKKMNEMEEEEEGGGGGGGGGGVLLLAMSSADDGDTRRLEKRGLNGETTFKYGGHRTGRTGEGRGFGGRYRRWVRGFHNVGTDEGRKRKNIFGRNDM